MKSYLKQFLPASERHMYTKKSICSFIVQILWISNSKNHIYSVNSNIIIIINHSINTVLGKNL